jgi:hypothetical protein
MDNAVVFSARPHRWLKKLNGLNLFKYLILHYYLKYSTFVLNARQKLKVLKKIPLNRQNFPLFTAPCFASINLATFQDRRNLAGRIRPPTFPDDSHRGNEFPKLYASGRQTDMPRFCGDMFDDPVFCQPRSHTRSLTGTGWEISPTLPKQQVSEFLLPMGDH